METHQRTLVKALIWRIASTFLSWVVVYWNSGNTEQATKVSLLVAVVLFIGYYLNERLWAHINWGRTPRA